MNYDNFFVTYYYIMPLNRKVKKVDKQIQFDLKESTKKGIYTGVIAGVASYLFLNEKGNSQFLDMNVPSAVAIGGSLAIGSVVADYTNEYLNTIVDIPLDYQPAENTLVRSGIEGVVGVAAMKLTSNINPSLLGFGVGAASSFAGQAVSSQIDPLAMLF